MPGCLSAAIGRLANGLPKQVTVSPSCSAAVHAGFVLSLAAAIALPGVTKEAYAQNFPSRRIELIVPVAAGGGLDLHARILSEQLSAQLGQRVVVVNRPGAAGTLGAANVAQAKPDGHTILLQSVSTAVAVVYTMNNLTYDPVKDLAPVSLMASFPLVMTANKDLAANNLAEFIDLLRKNPGKYNYGHSGVGSQLEMVGEFFKARTGTDIVGIPYQGTGPILPDLLSGRVAIMFNGLPAEIDRIKNGQVKAFAVTSAQRSPVAPDLPALKETFPNFDMPFWIGIYAPAKTPNAIVDKLSSEVATAVRSEAVKKRLADMGSEAVGSTPEELDAYWKDQLKLYADVMKAMKGRGG
jgi:tripartite-type tricarboxylate transporter receptor subunit TctC